MGRPPVEWPIPVYVTELRQRLVLTAHAPAVLLAPHIPSPLHLDDAGGQALLSLSIGSGRCLKSPGNPHSLAGDFHLVELLTPVLWRPACKPMVRGQYLLRLWTDLPGVARLARTALGVFAQRASVNPAKSSAQVSTDAESPLVRIVSGPEPVAVDAESEDPEAIGLHPECYFFPDANLPLVRAVPVHQYARATTCAEAGGVDLSGVEAALGVGRGVLHPAHVFLQKRCTHTWSFPPESIPLVRRALAA